MDSYKLATSRPAQAVGTSDNSRRTDSNSGVTVGNPPAGVGAAGALGGHNGEIPLLQASPGVPVEPTTSPRSRRRRPGPAAPTGGRGSPPNGAEVEDSASTNNDCKMQLGEECLE